MALKKPLAIAAAACVMLSASLAVTALAAERSTAKPAYLYMVFSNPVAGMEEEFNRWYTQQHLKDLVSVPGFVSAQRFQLEDQQLDPAAPPKPRYLAVYKIVTGDLAAVGAEIKRRIDGGQIVMSPSVESRSTVSFTYRALAGPARGRGGEPGGARPGPVRTYDQVVFSSSGGTDAGQEIAALKGVASWESGVVNDLQLNGSDPGPGFVSLFQIVTADLPAVLRELRAIPDSAFTQAGVFSYTYRAMGPLISGDRVRTERAVSNRLPKVVTKAVKEVFTP